MNMLATIVPKSDQMNSDDLIGGSRTITLTRAKIDTGDEQPVSLNFEGDNGKPYKPCKSMRRVIVQAWGADANAYPGRAMTLYRDAGVRFGGMDVGGIRISHMTDLPSGKALMMALTATRGNKKPFTVKPLAGVQRQALRDPDPDDIAPQDDDDGVPFGDGVDDSFTPALDTIETLRKALESATREEARGALWARLQAAKGTLDAADAESLRQAIIKRGNTKDAA